MEASIFVRKLNYTNPGKLWWGPISRQLIEIRKSLNAEISQRKSTGLVLKRLRKGLERKKKESMKILRCVACWIDLGILEIAGVEDKKAHLQALTVENTSFPLTLPLSIIPQVMFIS